MSKDNEGMPFVPEEDLNLHENFAPIIAENGVIRPSEEKREEIPVPDAWATRMDIVQDLVALRSAQEKEKSPKETSAQASLPSLQEDKLQEKEPNPIPTAEQKPIKPAPAEDKKNQKEKRAHRFFKKKKKNASPKPAEQNASSVALSTSKNSAEKPTKKLVQKPAEQPVQNPADKPVQKPAEESLKNPVEQPAAKQTSPKPQAQLPAPKKPRRWPWVVVVLCFLFLGTITGVVPVEKIPFLRNLAYAMGFTRADTERMSFLRALLTWTDKTVGFPSGQNGTRASLWARLFGTDIPEDEREDLASLQARLERSGGKTSLIDIQALNTLQRQKGRRADEIKGSAWVNPGSEQGQDPASVRDTNVSVHTESNQDKSDVFFGSDATATARNFQDGYDSVNTLKKLANPYIANGTPIDWLQNTAQRMMRSDVGLGGVNRGLQNMQVNWGNNKAGMGEGKPQKDLYFAWITSRMAQKTPNLMLKKALVDTGFMGADFPATASNAVEYGGVQIDLASFQEDQEAWREYLEWEKKCKEELFTSGDQVSKLEAQFNTLVKDSSQWDFPNNCAESNARNTPYEGTNFARNIGSIQNTCKQLERAYSGLRDKCSMSVRTHANNCSAGINNRYAGYWQRFQASCAQKFEEDFAEWWKQNQSNYTSEQEGRKAYENGKWKEDGKKHTQEDFVNTVTSEADFTKNQEKDVPINNMLDVVIDQNGGSSDYFPSVDTSESVKNQLEINKTL